VRGLWQRAPVFPPTPTFERSLSFGRRSGRGGRASKAVAGVGGPKARVYVPNAFYPVITTGDYRHDVFLDAADHQGSAAHGPISCRG